MKKFIIMLAITVLAITVLAITLTACSEANSPQANQETTKLVPPTQPTPAPLPTSIASVPADTATAVEPRNFKNITIEIDGQPVTLENGVSEVEAAPGSAAKIVTKFFGNQVSGVLPGDRKPGVVFLITQDPGGSGTFFYVIAAIQNDSGGYSGTNAILLGDRVAPQNIVIEDDQIAVNYVDRKPGEPMTTAPSVGVSKYFQVQQGQLVEIPSK